MIKIAICDDEILMASEIETLVLDMAGKHGIKVKTEVFCNAIELEKNIFEGDKYDLLYLDIQMDQRNGIAAAHNIRKIDVNISIIYVSSYAKFIEDIFEVDAVGFIKKPIAIKRFEQCFLKAVDKITRSAENFECHYKKEWLRFSYGEILYFESRGRKIRIHLVGEQAEEFNSKLDEIEINLKDCKIPFLRIHKSYLVNFRFIRAFSRTSVRLVTGRILPISLERHNEIREIYGKLLGGEISD